MPRWNRWTTFPGEAGSQVRGKHGGNYRRSVANGNEAFSPTAASSGQKPPSSVSSRLLGAGRWRGGVRPTLISSLQCTGFWRSMQHEGICVLIKAVCSEDRCRPNPQFGLADNKAARRGFRPAKTHFKLLQSFNSLIRHQKTLHQSQRPPFKVKVLQENILKQVKEHYCLWSSAPNTIIKI